MGPSTNPLIPPKDWHHLTVDETVGFLVADLQEGLTPEEAGRRRDRYGPNALATPQGKGPARRFLLQFHQPLVYLLLAAGAVTAALGEIPDAGVIFGVVLLNAAIGYVQEAKAVRALEALARTLSAEATVLRGGEPRRVKATEVVPGDTVLLQTGDRVPADLRIAQCSDLHVDESALTGESLPVRKAVGAVAADAPLADRLSMAYASTLVTRGQGRGAVVATGDDTEVGRISSLLTLGEAVQTPLTRRIAAFSRVLMWSILGLAALTFAVGILQGQPADGLFLAAVALAVGAIPEGLPAAVTIILAIGVSRMARRRAIIRRLPAVETLGSATAICTDKTGTLTENQMTVREILAGGVRYRVTGTGYSPTGEILREGDPPDDVDDPVLAECLRCGFLCNDASLVETEGRWEVQGDPTEGALIVSAHKFGLRGPAEAGALPRLDAIPFDASHPYMATLHDRGEGRPRVIYLKGAAETVVEQCSRPGWEEAAAEVLEAAEEMASRGLRVLAFARGELPGTGADLNRSDVASGLTFLGLQAMMDPPRPETMDAVAACRRAGIRVMMITGDHARTAAAVAQEIGLAEAPVRTLSGKELAALSDADLAAAVEGYRVFARVSPEQKLRLVRALQARGHVVAMTGDGVNDAPALRRADIGVAMGVSGTEVAKEAAEMVLTDDNFATIEAAVEEGRGVFDNLVKFLVWTLPTNLGLALVITAAIFADLTLPMLPVQVLWINMTAVVLLGTALAFEPREPEVMARPPRDPTAPLLDRVLIGRVLLVSVLLLLGTFALHEWQELEGASPAEARTTAVNLFVLTAVGYLFSCRSLHKPLAAGGRRLNPWALAGSAAMAALQLLFTYAPPMNRLFHSAPINVGDWAGILGAAAATVAVVEVEKRLTGRLRRPG